MSWKIFANKMIFRFCFRFRFRFKGQLWDLKPNADTLKTKWLKSAKTQKIMMVFND